MAAQPDDVLLMMGCYTEDNETKGDEENPSPTEDKDQPNSEVTKETTQKNSAAPDIEADSLISLSAIIAAKRKESTDSKESNGPEKKKSRKSKAPQRFVDFVDEVPGLDDDIQDIDDDLPEQETSFKLEPTWDDDDLIENDIDGDVNANMTGTPSVANNFPEMAKQLHRTPSSSGLHRSPLSSSMETTLVSGKPTLLNTGFNAGEEKVGVWAHRNLMPNCDVCHQKMFSPKDAGRHKDCHAGTDVDLVKQIKEFSKQDKEKKTQEAMGNALNGKPSITVAKSVGIPESLLRLRVKHTHDEHVKKTRKKKNQSHVEDKNEETAIEEISGVKLLPKAKPLPGANQCLVDNAQKVTTQQEITVVQRSTRSVTKSNVIPAPSCQFTKEKNPPETKKKIHPETSKSQVETKENSRLETKRIHLKTKKKIHIETSENHHPDTKKEIQTVDDFFLNCGVTVTERGKDDEEFELKDEQECIEDDEEYELIEKEEQEHIENELIEKELIEIDQHLEEESRIHLAVAEIVSGKPTRQVTKKFNLKKTYLQLRMARYLAGNDPLIEKEIGAPHAGSAECVLKEQKICKKERLIKDKIERLNETKLQDLQEKRLRRQMKKEKREARQCRFQFERNVYKEEDRDDKEIRFQRALADMIKGKKTRTIAKVYGIPESSLRSRMKRILEGKGATRDKYTWTTFTAEQEQRLAEHCSAMYKLGYRYTCRHMLDKAVNMARALEPRRDFFREPGKEWFYRYFCKRFPELAVIKGQQGKKYTITKEILHDYFKDLEETLAQLEIMDNPSHIWTVCETGVSLDYSVDEMLVIDTTAGKSEYLTKPECVTDNISPTMTLMATVSAIGETLPPYFISKGESTSPEERSVFEESLAGWSKSSTGWSNPMIFSNFVQNHMLSHLEERPILLLYSGFSTHVTPELIHSLRQDGVHLFVQPPRCNFQPLDQTVFTPFKRKLAKCVKELMQTNQDTAISQTDLPGIMTSVFSRSMSADAVMDWFGEAGIFPFNQQDFSVQISKLLD